jgi:hypothetical protein
MRNWYELSGSLKKEKLPTESDLAIRLEGAK